MRIAFASSEVVPFAKTGGMADVCGALPLALEYCGADVLVFLPYYRAVAESGLETTRINDVLRETKIGQNVRVFFVEHDKFFGRDGLYGDANGDYSDNLARYAFFCQEVLAGLKALGRPVDIMHCHDWQTGLIPAYLQALDGQDPFFNKTRSVLTVHNLAFQGVFPHEQFSQLDLPEETLCDQGLLYYDQLSLLKGGLIYADEVTTVSPNYAREIQTDKLGCGLSGVLRGRSPSPTGILNGLDYEIWDPSRDALIAQTYGADDLREGKAANKKVLCQQVGLSHDGDLPIFGFVGRLSHQKGIDLILSVMADLLKMDIRLVFLGVGESKYEQALTGFADRYPDRLAVYHDFNEPAAHQIYAGSDLFLMPSVFEPCGLSQMISLRYGTVPLVYRTGGLADTITPFEQGGNGLVFLEYAPEAFLETIVRAQDLYREGERFWELSRKGLDSDFSWDVSPRQYLKLYKKILTRDAA